MIIWDRIHMYNVSNVSASSHANTKTENGQKPKQLFHKICRHWQSNRKYALLFFLHNSHIILYISFLLCALNSFFIDKLKVSLKILLFWWISNPSDHKIWIEWNRNLWCTAGINQQSFNSKKSCFDAVNVTNTWAWEN